METEQLKKMVADLDAAVPRDDARVQFSVYGGGPDESKVVANQAGYLRLGIEFLRAAFAPPSPKSPDMIDVDLSYLAAQGSIIRFDWFERREDLAERKSRGAASKVVAAVVAGVCIVGLILAFIGLGTVVGWLSR